MIITEYVIPLGENARKRHIHKSDKGKVTDFTVQLEIFIYDHWKVAIRYDYAHRFAHIDQYSLNGREVKKDLHLKIGEALSLADEDIKENWKVYQEAYLKG